ncbi:carboxylesterase family protein [Saccharopolyspora erythraea]|uniref:carboxylesterase/lipase family protein n=1 Tax=Saccharopolyspora erythraea TaxID=1836 RepID=UPI001BADE5D3|nr:carboxylesterase family protein [Saccharopolyspora erythraea]QUH01011.1 carboxylesterase family protein [Saccharopolyspora erythraea]
MNDAIVELDSGRARGRVLDDHRVFQGIPYAAPPVGGLRWRSPQPVQPWADVLDATEPGSPCPQTAQVFAAIESLDEDCLNLNVTTPDTPGPKPVMVWLHGGGGANGEGAIFDAHRLAVREDVVVVTPNSRLGIFGYFGYPGLEGSGGFGIEDQQAALRWVRRNIAAFGGDPGNVTLFGESYGAFNIGAHLASPSSSGLFHRAVVQSGFTLMDAPAGTWMPGTPALPTMWLSTAELDGLAAHFVEQSGWLDAGRELTAVEQLRRVPVGELLELSPYFTRPAYGNAVLPESPDEAVRAGRFNRVPTVVGGTRDEARLFVALFFDLAGQPVTAERYAQLLGEAFGGQAAQVEREYPLSDYDTPSLAWAQVAEDRAWARATWDLAHALAAHTPTYCYEFADRDAPPIVPFPEGFPPGAHHSAEVAYQFDLGEPAALSSEQWRLAEQINAYWANFARSGDPGSPDLPAWGRFDPADPYVQALAPGRTGRTDFAAGHRLDFWEKLR